MKKLSDKEILQRAELLKKRHNSEWAQLIYDACVGRTMGEVARLVGYSGDWVRDRLDEYAINEVVGVATGDPAIGGQEKREQLIKHYAPKQVDSEYVADYEAAGHTPEVAKRLARVYEAAEVALDSGAIKESVNRERERVREIALPQGVAWEMELRTECNRLKVFAAMLNAAKITDLKKKITRDRIAEAHAKWMEQIERIENFHPTFLQEVESHEA
jgi:hypothetical protein